MRLSKNTILNLLGAIVPLLFTLGTLPIYLHLIGEIRFGVLAIVWLLLSYFGLFDMGLGRATSKYIAELHDRSDQERQSLFWTVLLLNAGMGMVGGLILYGAGHFLLARVLNVPVEMRAEVISAVPWLAASVPVATIVSVLTGSLEGREKFLSSNVMQVFGAAVFQGMPLAVAYWHGPQLQGLIGSAVLARSVASVPMFLACKKHIPLISWPHVDIKQVRKVLSFGGWVTITGLLTPLLNGLDRFVISIGSGPQALAYYSIAYNFSTKLTLIPGSASRALFPAFSQQTESTANKLARDAVLGVAAILTPIVMTTIILVHPFFTVWLGPNEAQHCFRPAEILLLGIWINGLAFVPYALLQGQNRPDLVAKFHALEIVPFMIVLWLGIRIAGVEGAAWAWTVRVIVDGLLLFWAAKVGHTLIIQFLSASALITVTLFSTKLLDIGPATRIPAAVLIGAFGVAWSCLAAPTPTRNMIRAFVHTLTKLRPAARVTA